MVLASRLISYNSRSDLFDPPAYCDPYFSKGKKIAYTNFVSKTPASSGCFTPWEMTMQGPVNAFSVGMVNHFAPEKTKKLFERRNAVERIWYTGKFHSDS